MLSRTTSRRDLGNKREYSRTIGVGEYWMVDDAMRTIRIARAQGDDELMQTELLWHPAGASEPFVIDVETFFRDALG